MKKYNAPTAYVMVIAAEDILTISLQAQGAGKSFAWDEGSDTEVY